MRTTRGSCPTKKTITVRRRRRAQRDDRLQRRVVIPACSSATSSMPGREQLEQLLARLARPVRPDHERGGLAQVVAVPLRTRRARPARAGARVSARGRGGAAPCAGCGRRASQHQPLDVRALLRRGLDAREEAPHRIRRVLRRAGAVGAAEPADVEAVGRQHTARSRRGPRAAGAATGPTRSCRRGSGRTSRPRTGARASPPAPRSRAPGRPPAGARSSRRTSPRSSRRRPAAVPSASRSRSSASPRGASSAPRAAAPASRR